MRLVREEADECLQNIERNLLALESTPGDAGAVDAIFRDAHSIKGSAAMVGWEEAAAIAHGIEDRLELVRDRSDFDPKFADPLLKASDALRRAVGGERGVADAALTALDESWPLGEGVREPASESPAPPHAGAEAGNGGPRSSSMRVDPGKVDRMLDAVGETVLHHRRLEHLLGQHELEDTTEEELDVGGRLLNEFHSSVIEMRTLPLSSITAPFPRLVRDLAADLGKEVELTISGADTQLDRVILEGISETITHLLRNAVVHGIELPDEREQSGKPRLGSVELHAQQRQGMVAVTVADDGHGVSRELLARGEETGSLAEVLATPGLSTAEVVSGAAGRGVGVDAVKENIERLGGSLEVVSEPGRGTEIEMLLPLTLALLQVLVFERGGWSFGLPMAGVREVISAEKTSSLEGQPSVELRGELIPMGDLASMIGASAPALPDQPSTLIVAASNRHVAVACDHVVGDEELVIKPLGPILAAVPGYLGAAMLGDGRIVLVLDPRHLVKMPTGTPGAPTRPLIPPQRKATRRVLVVDDQFSVRELQRSILETAGYRVDTARDGNDALARLRGNGHIDLVLTDIQMPGMDGLELLREIRQDPELESLPVVVVTSKASEEDKRQGVESGADAYIVKKEFGQEALLETLERLVGR